MTADAGMLLKSEDTEVVGDTGRLVLAAVEGLRSCAGEGWRFMEADWMAEAMSTAGEDMSSWCACSGVVVASLPVSSGKGGQVCVRKFGGSPSLAASMTLLEIFMLLSARLLQTESFKFHSSLITLALTLIRTKSRPARLLYLVTDTISTAIMAQPSVL